MATSPTDEGLSDEGTQSPILGQRREASEWKSDTRTGKHQAPIVAALPTADYWIRGTGNPEAPERSAKLTRLDHALKDYEQSRQAYVDSLRKHNLAQAEHLKAQAASERTGASAKEQLDANSYVGVARRAAAEGAIRLGNSFDPLNRAFNRVVASYEKWHGGLWNKFKASLVGTSKRDAKGTESELKEAIELGRAQMSAAAPLYKKLVEDSTNSLEHWSTLSPALTTSPTVFAPVGAGRVNAGSAASLRAISPLELGPSLGTAAELFGGDSTGPIHLKGRSLSETDVWREKQLQQEMQQTPREEPPPVPSMPRDQKMTPIEFGPRMTRVLERPSIAPMGPRSPQPQHREGVPHSSTQNSGSGPAEQKLKPGRKPPSL